jgi:mannose-1-phosphate guanylyltransferase
VLPLSGTGRPLLRETYERIRPLAAEVYVLTEQRQVPLIRKILPELKARHLIVEPEARGTTNALGLAAMTLAEADPEAVMMSIPADHVVRGKDAFGAAVRRAAAVAEASGELVTVGLLPRYPATGFGYIEAREPVSVGRLRALRVARFVEKPDAARARRFLAAGDFYWNLAMFGWRVGAFLAELKLHGPVHHAGLQPVPHIQTHGLTDRRGESIDQVLRIERHRQIVSLVPSFDGLHRLAEIRRTGRQFDAERVELQSDRRRVAGEEPDASHRI